MTELVGYPVFRHIGRKFFRPLRLDFLVDLTPHFGKPTITGKNFDTSKKGAGYGEFGNAKNKFLHSRRLCSAQGRNSRQAAFF
jgi:hypothetical protein